MLSCLRIEDQILLKKVYQIAKERKVRLYLVGGILRDALLERDKENPDIANVSITVDISRHIYHYCSKAPPQAKERIDPCPRPSH